jgi:hypothetical protein
VGWIGLGAVATAEHQGALRAPPQGCLNSPELPHLDRNKCPFCGDGHEVSAVVAFCLRESGAEIWRAGICVDCAGHDDVKLAEMTQQQVFPEFLAFVKTADELEAMGLLETVEIEPMTGMKRRRDTGKGQKLVKSTARMH